MSPRRGAPPLFKPVFSIVAMVSGILSGLGILVLLHQNGSVYPTRNAVIAAAVLGLAWGILLPSFTRAMRVSRLRSRRT